MTPLAALVRFERHRLKPRLAIAAVIFVPAEAFGLVCPGAVSARPLEARSCRLGRGLGAGQRLGTGRQGTCEIPRAPTGAACRAGNAG